MRVLVAAAAVLALAATASAQSGRVELAARPTNLGPVQNVLLTGGVSSGRTGETVTVQAKLCGTSSFRTLFVVKTAPGGRFTREWGPGINMELRAVWKGAKSRIITVRQSPFVQLDQTSPGEWEVGVGSLGMMWRKRVEIQRRVGSRWTRVRSVVLTETYTSPGQSGVWTDADFTMRLPKGTVLRAVLTAAQARPCYLGSISNTVRA
jgi:hypothetical protein